MRKMNSFIKSSIYNDDLVGCVWPGDVYYNDFNHPNASEVWYQGLKKLADLVQPSGIWLDMNEFSNFAFGEIPPEGNCGDSKYTDYNELADDKKQLKFDP